LRKATWNNRFMASWSNAEITDLWPHYMTVYLYTKTTQRTITL